MGCRYVLCHVSEFQNTNATAQQTKLSSMLCHPQSFARGRVVAKRELISKQRPGYCKNIALSPEPVSMSELGSLEGDSRGKARKFLLFQHLQEEYIPGVRVWEDLVACTSCPLFVTTQKTCNLVNA